MSRNLEVALHLGEEGVRLPDTPPTNIGDTLVVTGITPDGALMGWGAGGGGGPGGGPALPTPTRAGQFLVANATMNWTVAEADAGRW